MVRRERPRPARVRSIRTTLAELLIIPVVALVGLWALLATITVGNALTEYSNHRAAQSVGSASDTLVYAIQGERLQTFLWLSEPSGAPAKALTASRKTDDAAISSYQVMYPRSLTSRGMVMDDLGKIAGIRAAVDARSLTAAAAFQAYSGIMDTLFGAYLSTTVPDVNVQKHTAGAIDSGRALEQLSRELVILAAAQFTPDHQLPPADVALFASTVGSQNLLVEDALAQADPQLHANLSRLYASPLHSQVAALESQIASGAATPQTLGAFYTAALKFINQFKAVSNNAAVPLGVEYGKLSRTLFLQAGLAGGLGLIAVAGVVLLMIRFGRRIRTELTDLHDGAEAMASVRLPALVARLSEGDDVDVALSSPPLPAGRITEIARVAEAFSAVQRTAVDAAVGQASIRKGVSKVFVNLSLRNQSILHRQLAMLDSLERATDDPAALADLFRLDHLTTRMRRHAESLIILSGASTGRSWREPVRLVDVLRAAVAEVEDYTRIEVAGTSDAAVLGPAANDVVHLLAELMENATSFSPPNTKVETRVDTVGNGVAIEIEDRGLGLTRAELAVINDRLSTPPGFDVVGSEHLGLFVVGQLATRHRISVALRRSHYGGVTAVVLLPHSVIVPLAEAAPALAGSFAPPLPAGNGSAHDAATQGFRGARGPFEPLRHQGDDTEQFRYDTHSATQVHRVAAAQQDGPDPGSWPMQGDTYRGLPRRVRQASLAPQLQNGRAQAAGSEPARYDRGEYSPEQTRSTLSSLQDGWQRGRSDELDWPGDGPSRPFWNSGERDPS